jgi:hypothetical protein
VSANELDVTAKSGYLFYGKAYSGFTGFYLLLGRYHWLAVRAGLRFPEIFFFGTDATEIAFKLETNRAAIPTVTVGHS